MMRRPARATRTDTPVPYTTLVRSPFPPDIVPLPFQGSDEGTLERKMKEAGLLHVRVVPVAHSLPFRAGGEMWNWVTSSNPIALEMISSLDDEQRNQVVQLLEKRIR